MTVEKVCFTCGPHRQWRHSVVRFDLDPREDADTCRRALDAAKQHGGTPLSPSGAERGVSDLLKTRYLGALGEQLLVDYMQSELGEGYIVRSEPFSDYESHVDIIVGNQAARQVTCEVRGSFPYRDMIWVLGGNARPGSGFDVIGPYETSFKEREQLKDFYLRVLINQRRDQFDYRQPHTVWSVGGAEAALFETKGHWDRFKQGSRARYRAIKPIARGRDAEAVLSMINGALE